MVFEIECTRKKEILEELAVVGKGELQSFKTETTASQLYLAL
jgi:hypothetical protein